MTMNKHSSVISVLFSKPFLGILLLFTVVSLLNIPVLITLWRHGFDDGTYSHAFLIPFISLYLYFLLAETGKLQFRNELAITPTVLLVISCYLLFVTANAQISVGYWGALLAVFITSVTMLYRFNWYIVFPAAFLIFIFPFWGILVPILQNISVVAVTYMMSFTGVPTYVEAEIITIPAGVFEIAGGCSGLRYMIVSLAIGSLFIFLNIRDTKKAVLFLSLTILGALLTNWIRITALILIGEYTNMESSLMDDHNTFGWYLYVPFMILLFQFGNRLSNHATKEIVPFTENKVNSISYSSILAIITLSTLSSTSLKMIFSSSNIQIINTEKTNRISPLIHHFSGLEFEGNTNKRTYFFNGVSLDAKPTYYENELLPAGWQVLDKVATTDWHRYLLKQNNKMAILSTAFEIDNIKVSSPSSFKKFRLIKALNGNHRTKLNWYFEPCISPCVLSN